MAQSGEAEGTAQAAISASGNLALEDLFDAAFFEAIAPDGTDPGDIFALTTARAEDLEPIDGVTLALSAALGNASATATATNGSLAIAQSATWAGYIAAASAYNDSVATAQEDDAGTAFAIASNGSKAAASGVNSA